jgi:hypothetical protein
MTTEAGKRLLDSHIDCLSVCEIWAERESIVAIEAEARAAALVEVYGYAEHYLAREKARISDEVKGMPLPVSPNLEGIELHPEIIAAVLRIIEGETDD